MSIADTVRDLEPGSFAMAMATGIVALALHAARQPVAARVLFGVDVVLYAALLALSVVRVVRFPRRVAEDLASDTRGPGFLTTVAATALIGQQSSILFGAHGVALAAWFVALLLWIGLLYPFLAAVVVQHPKVNLRRGLHGGWLVVVVSTQSVGVLALSAADVGVAPGALRAAGLAFFLLGCALYVPIITLILYRLGFVDLSPTEFTPPYWINMGAAAISTLAGAGVAQHADRLPLVRDVHPFVLGLALLSWAVATFWLPLLVVLESSRHVVRRVPLTYQVANWDIVFPVGMYAACTFELSRATAIGALVVLARPLTVVAALMWALTFFGLVRRGWHNW